MPLDTATSNSQGQVSFTKSPVSMGNHTFQLRYNGDTGYYATTSSIVSRTINKETSVLNVSLPLDNANYYDYENIAVTGTLYDNDGDLIEGTSVVKVYNGSTLLESVNVSNGSFSISNLTDIAGTIGDYTLTIIYEGNDYYTASSVNRTIHIVEEILYDGISLSSDKSILSYHDSESATLTAQLKNGTSDVAISGVAIEWFVDDVSQGSINTNNSGRSVFTYNSAGVGDVTIEAKLGSSSSEIFVVEDCIYWNETEVTRSTTNGSTIYDNNLAIALPSNCEITLEAWSNNSTTGSGEHRFFMLPKSQYNSGTTQPQYGLYFDLLGQNNAKFGKRQSNSSVTVGSSFSATRSTYHTVKLVKTGTSIAFYFNDELKTTESESWIDDYTDYCFSMMRWTTGGTSRLRNVKIKPL